MCITQHGIVWFRYSLAVHGHTAHTPDLSELITNYHPSRAFCSSNRNLLARPSGITSNFTSWACSVSAPSTWNSLPPHIRSLDKLSTFKCQLKSHLFQSAFAVYSPSASTSDSFNSRFWRYINLYVCTLCLKKTPPTFLAVTWTNIFWFQ